MARPPVNPLAWVLAIATAAALLVAGVIGYRRYTEQYTVTTQRDTGLAVAQVVRATFRGASDLKVGGLSGTVQSVAEDRGLGGMLPAKRVVKAPFSVDYFVDLSGMGPGDFRLNERTRTLLVTAPDVRAAAPNVDEAHTTLDRTTGMFVTRGAMQRLQQQASARAENVAKAEALKPEHVAAARENARRALAKLLGGPLAAAGLGDVDVRVRFAGEARSPGDQWDLSRSLEEVLGNAR